MAVGKNKKLGKKAKGGKKKPVDPFKLKDWYNVRVPALFTNRVAGVTPVNKTRGQVQSADVLKGRVFEISLGDLNKDEPEAFRKVKLVCDEVRKDDCLCNFYGMDITRDKLCSVIRKWQTLIEAHVDVKTADGYTVRMFCIGFTARQKNQVSKTSYAKSAQVRAIRKKMFDIMTKEASNVELKELFAKLNVEAIGKEITKACQNIYPLQNVLVRKVKMIKSAKFDLGKLLDVHGEAESK